MPFPAFNVAAPPRPCGNDGEDDDGDDDGDEDEVVGDDDDDDDLRKAERNVALIND